MRSIRGRQVCLALSCLLLLSLLAACGNASSTGTQAGQATTTGGSPNSNVYGPQPIETSCPAAGTARAALLPDIAAGKDAGVIYAVNGQPGAAGTLKSFDTVTKQKNLVLSIPSGTLANAELSPDGKWILFLLFQSPTSSPLELVRVDGQEQQTLYCGQIVHAIWSLDQKYIALSVVENQQLNTLLLNLGTGGLQTLLTTPDAAAQGFIAKSWLDDTHLYLREGDNKNIALVDLHHPNPATPPIVSTQDFQDFAISMDGQKLYTVIDTNSQASSTQGTTTYLPPASITVQPATGGPIQTLLNDSQNAITAICTATSQSFLLIRANALWEMNAEGSGLTLLARDSVMGAQLNSSSQFPWANVSRDGHLFAIAEEQNSPLGVVQSALVYGSLASGQPQDFATADDTLAMAIVGWTLV